MSTETHFAITADQVDSRHGGDAVPAALRALAELTMTLPFERTAGDEIQGLTTDPATVVAACSVLLRLGAWRIGIGVGEVEHPLASTTRAARGAAYLAAREAITEAHHEGIAVRGDGIGIGRADDAAIVWRAIVGRRSAPGWEVVGYADRGMSGREIAATLGVTPSAVSQRLRHADLRAGRAAAALFTGLLGDVCKERP